MNQDSLFPDILTRAERRVVERNPEPDFTYISLGAGVQSTTLALLAASGVLPTPRYAIFSDTGWEPSHVYRQLDRLTREVLEPAGIELRRVGSGNIRDETTSRHHFVRLPLYTRDPRSGKLGMMKRQCTGHYKLAPILREVRKLLGAKAVTGPCRYCDGTGERDTPWLVVRGEGDTLGPCSVCHGTGLLERVAAVRKGVWAQQWIGFSTDEIERVSDAKVPYTVSRFPLLDLDMSREDCLEYLAGQGWGEVAKSACIGCPFHQEDEWRYLRDHCPDEFAEAVEFDRQIRSIDGMDSEGYLHRSCVPLDRVDLDVDTPEEERRSCSPFGCRSGDPIDLDEAALVDDGLLF